MYIAKHLKKSVTVTLSKSAWEAQNLLFRAQFKRSMCDVRKKSPYPSPVHTRLGKGTMIHLLACVDAQKQDALW